MSPEIQNNTSNPWIQYMRSGDFEEAWKLSDRMLQRGNNSSNYNLPRHFQSIWDGTPLEGKRVLVRCYHGLGDTIQFIRYAPLLKSICREVIVWVQPPLLPILLSLPAIDCILPLHDGVPDVEYDVDVEVMELPHIFRTTLSTVPSKIPYLQVEPKFLSSQHKQFSVGLVWKSGDWNECRSIPFSFLNPLAKIQGIQLYILQSGATAAGCQDDFGINPGEFCLYDYARVISGLDLVITVDSMPAHLAGALGTPVWTLLHTEADWRWMEKRSNSPWYPTMRLFRQEREGDWEPVINMVTKELENIVKRDNSDSFKPGIISK